MIKSRDALAIIQCTYRWRRASQEDQGAQVGGALVAEGAGGVDEGTNTVRLECAASERSTPCGGSRRSLLGAQKFLLGVGGLGAVVGFAKDRAKDGEGGDVVEDGAEGDGRGLNGGKVCRR